MFPDKFSYRTVIIMDAPSQNLSQYFESVSKWIKSAISKGGTVFVHCWAGKSRSAAMVIAYLMKELAINFDSATLLVRKARPIIYPNPGFKT